MKQVSIILIAALLTIVSCKEQNNTKMEVQEAKELLTTLKGKTITWTWTEGAFKGGKYEVTLLTDGKIYWKGLEGAEKGQEATDKEYRVAKISKNVHTLSWLESVGWTVTVTLNLEESTAYGFVSNDKEWYPLSGVIDSIK